MKLSGSHTFNAPRDKVWATLIDIEALRTLIPGVESLEEVEPNTYKGVAKIGVAGIKGEYTGTVKLTDIDAPTGYRLLGDGRGKPGHVKGEGTLELVEEAPNQTLLRYAGDVQVGGMIASVGQRLIEGAAKLLINQGMKALAQRVEQQG
ncbi:MAG: carbon monoxide dehydrogenase subunit G [Chloroflexi bacterium]|nr:carbon monoxide dehydrogenase subunit G [Chloroflexota bacterium]